METVSPDPQSPGSAVGGPEDLVRRLLTAIGEDPDRPGLKDTPARVVRSWAELFGGYNEDPEKILSKTFEGPPPQRMVCVNDITYSSSCEHHMLPFHGVVDIAYLPTDHVVGLSKLPRLVACFSRRLQLQERMTYQIAEALFRYVPTRGVAVRVQGHHTCMSIRGARNPAGIMTTYADFGALSKDKTRDRWLQSLPPPMTL